MRGPRVRMPVQTEPESSARDSARRAPVRWVLGARVRVALVTVSLLLALDVGRSLWARVGYARPREVWQPDARVYADLTWPPGGDLPADAPLGQQIDAQRCAV
jgi:hypothetical protein